MHAYKWIRMLCERHLYLYIFTTLEVWKGMCVCVCGRVCASAVYVCVCEGRIRNIGQERKEQNLSIPYAAGESALQGKAKHNSIFYSLFNPMPITLLCCDH